MTNTDLSVLVVGQPQHVLQLRPPPSIRDLGMVLAPLEGEPLLPGDVVVLAHHTKGVADAASMLFTLGFNRIRAWIVVFKPAEIRDQTGKYKLLPLVSGWHRVVGFNSPGMTSPQAMVLHPDTEGNVSLGYVGSREVAALEAKFYVVGYREGVA